MMDSGMAIIEEKIQRAVTLIERLKEENQKLKNEIAGLQAEIQQLKEETGTMQEERAELKDKIDSAVSMLDKVDLDDVLDSIAEEVTKETEDDS